LRRLTAVLWRDNRSLINFKQKKSPIFIGDFFML
jgi:hypothetical protein